MKVPLLLVVLLGLLVLSHGFKIERRGRQKDKQGKNKPDKEGAGPDSDDDDDGTEFDEDDDFDDDDDDDDKDGSRRRDLPRLIVGAVAKRIQMQLDNCDLTEFGSEPLTIKGAIESLAELLLMDCKPETTGSTTTGSPPTGSSSGPSDSPSSTTEATLAARGLEDKVVRELLSFFEKNRH